MKCRKDVCLRGGSCGESDAPRSTGDARCLMPGVSLKGGVDQAAAAHDAPAGERARMVGNGACGQKPATGEAGRRRTKD